MALRLGIRVTRRIYRDGLARALDACAELSVVGATGSFTDLLRLTQTDSLDCVVVGARPGESDVRSAIAALRQARATMRIVVLHDLDRFELYRLRRLGANAFADERDGIQGVIDAVLGSQADVSSQRAQPLDAAIEWDRTAVAALTQREREVLELVSSGLTSRAISTHLAVSPKTIENHKQRIFHKLQVQNQGHAVAIALRAGLIAAIPDNFVIDLRDDYLETAAFDAAAAAV